MTRNIRTGKTNLEDVRDFQAKFNIPMPGRAQTLPEDLFQFRLKFMQEELDEFFNAHQDRDLAGEFDALLDLAYVVFGTALMMGLPWQDGWDRVQFANMLKQAGLPSKRHPGLDVTKPEGWEAPDLRDLVHPMRQEELFPLREIAPDGVVSGRFPIGPNLSSIPRNGDYIEPNNGEGAEEL